ncbi:hypothetical protein KFL_014740020 [Klebsormidium nitens]|uniref:Uncharacterized protein n=1 Tax=Klebsormidium nitens TaxID=105231 RepID=A0A1Y1IYG6_KLENI|nr:hypothetical protein KFL_014740020 [Klebsormidium nitens]|eukprot:GAQ93368.1 hypothetical protein KFL_014740020 [Klebsormidium nitens]
MKGPQKWFRCGPRRIPRLMGTEYFPRDVRNSESLPVRTAYEPDKPLVLYKPEGRRAVLMEGVFVVCHRTHDGPDVTRGRYLTNYDGEYQKRCLECAAQLSQSRRDKVFVPVIAKGRRLKVVSVRDVESETGAKRASKGRKQGDRKTLPKFYRLPLKLVPFLQKLLPLES